MSLKTVAENPSEHCYLLVEFAGPGSALITTFEPGPGVIPTQIMALAKVLELEGSSAYLEQRSKAISEMEKIRKGILTPG